MNISYAMLRKSATLSESEVEQILHIYKSVGYDQIYSIAKSNKILPFAAHLFCDLGIDVEKWKQTHNSYFERNRIIIENINYVFEKMKKNGVRSLCAMENFAVMLESEECHACFCSGDVDLTADTSERQRIEDTLSECGYLSDVRRHSMQDTMSNYQNIDVIDGGFWINLMWKPIARRALFKQNKIMDRLHIERNQAINAKHTSIRILNPDALMYFCIVHAASSHFFTLNPGIRLYTDIDRLIHGCDINWDLIKRWAVEDELGIRTDVLLYIYSQIMHMRVPVASRTSNYGSKYFEKLIRFLYNDKDEEFVKHNTYYQKAYVELLSDNMSCVRSIIRRIKN